MRIISGIARGTNLITLKGLNTRPTLDRIKESLFSIIQLKIPNAKVLDLFSGSGALGLESISRGARKAVLCDCNYDAIKIIKTNIVKCHFEEQIEVINKDYIKCLEVQKNKFDIIFIDPPYMKNIAVNAVKIIIDKNLLADDGIIILETDDEIRELDQLKNIEKINIQDLREYGRVKLIFLNRKG